MAEPVLRTENLTKRFGGLTAVDDVSLAIVPGRIHAIIGPNGAGKTTLFNLVTGLLPPTAGRVWFDGADITGLKAHRIAQRGISRTLQIKSVFAGLTVEENVWIAVQSRRRRFSPFVPASRYADTAARVAALLDEIGLAAVARQTAGTLSYGDVALLEIALALAGEPKLLLLDEPICGMSPSETERTVAKIRELSRKVNVVIIEHDMEVVFTLADDITVMAQGQIMAQGGPAEIAADPRVQEAYLGEPDDGDED